MVLLQVSEGDKAKADEEDPSVGQTRLQEPDDNEIRTVHAGDTPYTSAASFEDLPISGMLLQVTLRSNVLGVAVSMPAAACHPVITKLVCRLVCLRLLQGLYTEMKFEKPSRIQAKTLPMILTPPYRSLIAQACFADSVCLLGPYPHSRSQPGLLAQAHNGSGKTTCFVLAMLSRVDPKLAQPQALCVCPTRELVVQNLQVLERMGRHAGITATSTAAVDFQITRHACSVLLGSASAHSL